MDPKDELTFTIVQQDDFMFIVENRHGVPQWLTVTLVYREDGIKKMIQFDADNPKNVRTPWKTTET